MAARNSVSSEEWIEMGGDLSDEEYNARVLEMYGVQL